MNEKLKCLSDVHALSHAMIGNFYIPAKHQDATQTLLRIQNAIRQIFHSPVPTQDTPK